VVGRGEGVFFFGGGHCCDVCEEGWDVSAILQWGIGRNRVK
jgi:hypothetical protein